MIYNTYISYEGGGYNICGLSETKLQKLVNYYLYGKEEFTLSGKRYSFKALNEFRIFTFEKETDWQESVAYYLGNIHFSRKNILTRYLPPKTLLLMGQEVTENFIGDQEFGELISKNSVKSANDIYINQSRINELINIRHKDFDLCRLIKLCEELNHNYIHNNYLSVGMIGRTIINHVPPIFGFNEFKQVASNYGGSKENRSFKKSMSNLNDSLKNIADSYLHQTIRDKESLPNETQIDFKNEMDVLLSEIIRILK